MFLLQCSCYLCNPYISSIQNSVRPEKHASTSWEPFLKVSANFWWLTSLNTFCVRATLNLTSCTSGLLCLVFLFYASLFSILWPLQKPLVCEIGCYLFPQLANQFVRCCVPFMYFTAILIWSELLYIPWPNIRSCCFFYASLIRGLNYKNCISINLFSIYRLCMSIITEESARQNDSSEHLDL